jgi:membrane associated rhomboid family serine protease
MATKSTSLTAQPVRRAMMTAKLQVTTLATSLGLAWFGFAASALTGGALLNLGIIPRTTVGLRGILFAPFLHASFAHLLANTVPFIVLGWLVMLRDKRHFGRVTIAAALGSGLLSWLLGAPGSVHIGASGVIFGYLGFLMLSGWYQRSIGSVLLSLGVTAAWGSMVLGVLPSMPGVSWQGHLGGFIGGVLAARAFRTRR